MRAMNLTGVIMFLIGSVGVFQFLAANMYWPQRITDTIVGWGLTPLGFVFAYMGVLLILGMFVDGVAMILLTVPVIFPVAYAMKIDPVALGIMLTLNIEMGVVTPPVGLNLFAVSGTSKIPAARRWSRERIPFFVADARRSAAGDLLPRARHLAAGPAGERTYSSSLFLGQHRAHAVAHPPHDVAGDRVAEEQHEQDDREA